jgi:hypothetical protein
VTWRDETAVDAAAWETISDEDGESIAVPARLAADEATARRVAEAHESFVYAKEDEPSVVLECRGVKHYRDLSAMTQEQRRAAYEADPDCGVYEQEDAEPDEDRFTVNDEYPWWPCDESDAGAEPFWYFSIEEAS